MKRPAVRPRPEQVAELTRGVTLPLPVIQDEHLLVIAEVLRRAFDAIRRDHPSEIANGEEPEVTSFLQARLNKLINEDKLWGQLVVSVGRGTETISFDGSHIEKRPDLSIVLSAKDRRFPLTAEAKILNATAGQTIQRYCDKGLRRFITGEYAWARREAFMIAYVRDGSTIIPLLTTTLSKAQASKSDPYKVEELPVPVDPTAPPDLARTRHGRSFAYSESQPHNPGPITIWHLWLPATPHSRQHANQGP